ncbi:MULTISPECIES: ABC transporter ATP-binding protein [unclassified Enterobacter]|uniref:ABC transporter ATP-binding protein n=1 Tax=unclassified Enterobacter TaxID=2608935 RepID=UPI0015C70418|nr:MULTISPECIES: ABC transporter ATP-binding protein [unclassified Enterobacter]MBB3307418.1 peptide/nickel transport system ATP-binding protein [Enterobacter sp. Sphag1F]NYI15977.1 peptide/nickel transport system ATP-binding protein [Enterobacter sp. Sphag71]
MKSEKALPPEVLSVRDLHIRFQLGREKRTSLLRRGAKRELHAVRGINISIRQGETFSIVGESGCGKSTIARALAGLYTPSEGSIKFAWQSEVSDSHSAQNGTQMIFQDPYASLNPRWRIGRSLAEPLVLSKKVGSTWQARSYCGQLLEQVGLSANDLDKFPHEFSGGQRQRISIARALATQPGFLICDEPTSALDVSVQAQVLNLMRRLQQQHGLTYFFISHNMAVISHISDRVGVMYLGRIVEQGTVEEIFSRPAHPYTRLLIAAIPQFDNPSTEREPIVGEAPNPMSPPLGCAFAARCSHAQPLCQQAMPPVHDLSDEHQIECHFPAAVAAA